MLVAIETLRPVSYTHLDVYKRQAIATNYAKKNLYHSDWKKKAVGLALIYLAPYALKYVREKLDDYQKQETLKSLEKIM